MPVDLNIIVPSVLVAVPATIAAISSWRNTKRVESIRAEVTSPNGTTTAQAIQDIKLGLTTLAVQHEQHRADDLKVHGDQNSNIAALARALGVDLPSPN